MLVDQGFSLHCTHAQDNEVEINNHLGGQLKIGRMTGVICGKKKENDIEKKKVAITKSYVSKPATMAATTIGLLINGYERNPEEQVRQRGKQ